MTIMNTLLEVALLTLGQVDPQAPAAAADAVNAAQPAVEAAASEAGGGGLTVASVWDFLIKGGPVILPIALCSLVAFAVFLERLMNLRRSAVIPRRLYKRVAEAMESGGGPEEAKKLCEKNGSALAQVLAAGLRRLGEPTELLEKHVAEAGMRQVRRLKRRLRVLAVIGAVTPLLGLLGTILGMIGAFQTVASSAEALGRTELLAEGIYEAMISTAAGLTVAIPVIIAHHWLLARIDRLISDIDEIAVNFVERFARPSAAANGHHRDVAPTPHAGENNVALAKDPGVKVVTGSSAPTSLRSPTSAEPAPH